MARRMGKRKRVVIDTGIGEIATDSVEGPRNTPIHIGSWEEYVKHFGRFAATADDLQAVRAYFNENEIIDEENIVDSPEWRKKIVKIGRRSGMTHSAAVAAAYMAYLLQCKRSESMGKRGVTVGDLVRAADAQGKAIDMRFVPMSAEDKRKLSKMSRAGRLRAADEMMERVFGPILKELGLTTQEEGYDYPAMWERIIGPIREKLGMDKEEPMGQYKPVRDSASIRRYRARARKVLLKRPKVQLVTDLEAVMHDSLLLRDRIRELEQAARVQAEESDESKTQHAAAWLARKYVNSVRSASGPKYDEKMEEEWADLKEALQRLPKSQRVGIALIDEEEIFYHISGRLTPDTAVPFAYGLEELARVHGEEVVKLGGAAYLMRCILAAQKKGGK